MIKNPDTADLLEGLTEFVTSIAPKLEGHDAFLARVSLNALAILQRNETLGPEAKADAVKRLAGLLKSSGSDFESLNRGLCEAIKSGEIDETSSDLMAHLRAQTLDDLAINQPKYKPNF